MATQADDPSSPFYGLPSTFGQRMGAALSDKAVEAGLWLYDKLANREKMAAANRLILDSFVDGNRKPITSSSFTPEELSEISKLIALKDRASGGKGSGYVSYADYKSLPGMPTEKVGVLELLRGELPPRVSVSKALGQFNYKLDPKTGQYRVIDEYDFNPQKTEFKGKEYVVPEDFYGDYAVDTGFSPLDMLRKYAGRKMPPGKGRKVELSVPVEKARGGLAQLKECSCGHK